MEKSSKVHARVIVILVIAVLVTIFAVLNSKAVDISFGFKTVSISQAIVILVSILIGALLMYIITIISAIKGRSSVRSRKKKELEQEEEDKKNEDMEREERAERAREFASMEGASESGEAQAEEIGATDATLDNPCTEQNDESKDLDN